MEREFGAGLPGLPLSSYIRRGNTIYTSGCIAMDYTTGKILCPDDMAGQTRLSLEALRDILDEAGSSMEEIDFMMIYVKDRDRFQEMNKVYKEFFPDHLPARTTVIAEMVSEDALIELFAIAGVK